jgi:acetylglutamate kinase
MKTKLKVVKIGGNVLDDKTLLSAFLTDFAKLDDPKILVHGGGKKASEISEKLGLTPQLIDGRRITTDDDIEVVTMVYAGLLNKNIVAALQSHSCNAIGLTGADGNSIVSIKRPVKTIDFGWVGDVQSVNETWIKSLLTEEITPVFCALTHDGIGNLLNTNADTIAVELAISLAANFEVELIYCFEKRGVLEDFENEDSVFLSIDTDLFAELKAQKIIHSGMLPKLENCFYALNNKVSKVIIGSTAAINTNSTLHTTLTL